MLTYDPAIYAVGECVQHRDSTFGLVAPLWEQARVCAAYLAERRFAATVPQPVSDSAQGNGIDRLLGRRFRPGARRVAGAARRQARRLQPLVIHRRPDPGRGALRRHERRSLVRRADDEGRDIGRCAISCCSAQPAGRRRGRHHDGAAEAAHHLPLLRRGLRRRWRGARTATVRSPAILSIRPISARLCSKGSALGETLGLGGPAAAPAQCTGAETAWDTALDTWPAVSRDHRCSMARTRSPSTSRASC